MNRQAGAGSRAAPRPSRCRAASDGRDEGGPVEPGRLGEHAQLEARPGDGCELERRPVSGDSRDRRWRTTSRIRSGPAARPAAGRAHRRPTPRRRRSRRRSRQSSQRSSGVPSVSSPIADASSSLRVRLEARTNAPTSSALSFAEREPRHAVEARTIGERLGERGPDLLAAVAVGGEDEQPRFRGATRQTAQQLRRLAVGPVEVVGDEQQRLAARPAAGAARPPRSGAGSRRSRVAGRRRPRPVSRASSGTSRDSTRRHPRDTPKRFGIGTRRRNSSHSRSG